MQSSSLFAASLSLSFKQGRSNSCCRQLSAGFSILETPILLLGFDLLFKPLQSRLILFLLHLIPLHVIIPSLEGREKMAFSTQRGHPAEEGAISFRLSSIDLAFSGGGCLTTTGMRTTWPGGRWFSRCCSHFDSVRSFSSCSRYLDVFGILVWGTEVASQTRGHQELFGKVPHSLTSLHIDSTNPPPVP